MVDMRKLTKATQQKIFVLGDAPVVLLHTALDYIEAYIDVYKLDLDFSSVKKLVTSFRKVERSIESRLFKTTEKKMEEHGYMYFDALQALRWIKITVDSITVDKSMKLKSIKNGLALRYGPQYQNIKLK